LFSKIGKSRKWVYKWVKRAESGVNEWYRDKPSIALKIHNKIEKSIEEEVVEIRKELMNTRYSQIGANAINWELQKRGKKFYL